MVVATITVVPGCPCEGTWFKPAARDQPFVLLLASMDACVAVNRCRRWVTTLGVMYG